MTDLAVLGVCDDCADPSYVNLSPADLDVAVAAAGRFDRRPEVVPAADAARRMDRLCRCPKARIAARRDAA